MTLMNGGKRIAKDDSKCRSNHQKKEKSRKERDAVSKEKAAADAKEWIERFRKRFRELKQT